MQKCWVSSKKTILVFRVELLTPCSGKDALRVIAQAKYMLGKIDSKFVRSEQAIEFREQLALGSSGRYRGFRFKEAAAGDLPTVMIDGRKFNCVASIARAHGLDPVTVRRRIADTRKAADKLSNDEWKLILARKKVKEALHLSGQDLQQHCPVLS